MSDSTTVLKNERLLRDRRLVRSITRRLSVPSDLTRRILPENLFLGILCLERKRAERSGRRLLLLTIDAEEAAGLSDYKDILGALTKTVNASRRETDIAGWYREGSVLGVLFSEFGPSGQEATGAMLLQRFRGRLTAQLAPDIFRKVQLAVHLFANSGGNDSHNSENPAFYPDLVHLQHARRAGFVLKRLIDIVTSASVILLLLPLFAVIAILVKLTSHGPVLFQQQRLGQFGKPFAFLKFRSMSATNDSNIHRDFMKHLIKGEHDASTSNGSKPVYKMRHDPRVTKIGRFLRRTSLDELPQFLNVLRGEMSLVGPRPPIPYEYEEYEIWHRRRVLEVKPGITGLWQVKGRSRVSFDDMVRLDLQYARGWSIWLDLWILLQTPRAVLMGEGAY